MLQLANHSPFAALMFNAADLRGVDNLIVVIKASFELGPPLSVAAEQRPIVFADEYWGDPEASSLRYPSEAHLPKPGTDVILNGEAWAPKQQATTMVDTGLRVGERCKYTRVHGDRLWAPGYRGLEPCRPQAFVNLPIIYERAYGGRELSGAAEHENPVGVGFLGTREPEEFVGQPVPNLDDPQDPLRALGQRPTPAGFGALAPSWQPRVRYAGSYDEAWLERRAPFLPEDFDPRFFCCAPADMHFEQPLVGGEPVVMLGFDPDRSFELRLPRCGFDLRVRQAGEGRALRPVLDTLLLEPSDSRMAMIWRAALAVGDDLLRVEEVELALTSLEGAGDPSPHLSRRRPA